jgi:BirA family transcriptional regulator, biotin operon repressor / biotin---[acetyl-CoA-carboxylase] ligase
VTVDEDVIDVAELRRELIRPSSLWQQIDLVAETGSTNADLAAAARAGAASGTVLVTDHQSAGRGRLGRTWTAPPGTSIAMSVLVRPEGIEPPRWTWLPLLAGIAVADGIRAVAHLPALLKWPNDVLVGGRKLCGILAERVETPLGQACVVGMGINVAQQLSDLPTPTATSLAVAAADAGSTVPPRTALIAAVLAELELLVRRWEAAGDDAAGVRGYVERSDTLGRRVRVELGERSVQGVAEAVDHDGRLVVRTDAGIEVLGAGDVVHVR